MATAHSVFIGILRALSFVGGLLSAVDALSLFSQKDLSLALWLPGLIVNDFVSVALWLSISLLLFVGMILGFVRAQRGGAWSNFFGCSSILTVIVAIGGFYVLLFTATDDPSTVTRCIYGIFLGFASITMMSFAFRPKAAPVRVSELAAHEA